MIKEVIAVGADVAEAKENALAQLEGLLPENTDVEFEIVQLPKKKILGLFGGCPAKVRAFYEEKEDKPLKRVEKYERADKKPAKKNQNKPKKAEKPVQVEKAPKTEQPAMEKPELVAVEDPAKKATLDTGVTFVNSVLQKMEIDAKVTGGQLGSSLAIVLEGEHLGAIVGRRGETLDALQYLTTLVANRGEGDYQRITLNIGDYREKREKTLRSLARRMANNALKNGRNMTLEPMNPYERRIIHTAVQDVKGVTSWSVGDEPNRRVVIGAEKGKRGGNYRGGRGGNRRDAGQATPATEPAREQKKDQAAAPLYGRIG